jgi:tetratricopeptide (TPR) repeat protein
MRSQPSVIDREAVLQAAQKYTDKKKYDRAIVEYQKIIQVDPSDARTLLKMGDLQVKMGAHAEAIATYERVGRQYAQQGFHVKAVWVYKQIREILNKHVPQLEERYGHIGPKLAELYHQLGLTSDALATLDEVAQRLTRQGREKEAIELFRKAVDLDSQNPLPYLRLAEALSRARDPEGAATVFGQAASMLIKRQRPDDAIKVIERLLHHKPDPAQARIAAELYLGRGEPNDGMQALSKLQISFQANPKDLDTLALLSRAFSTIGQANKGIEVRKEMARIAREQGKFDLFRQLLDELLRTAPHDEQVKQLAASGDSTASAPPPAAKQALKVPTPPARQSSAPKISRPRDDAPIVHLDPEDDELAEELDLDESALMAEVQTDDRRPPPAPSSEAYVVHSADISEYDGPEMTVEEEPFAPEGSNEAQIAEILEEASSLRRRRMYSAALESLRIGLEMDPRAFELRYALHDVLVEAGRMDDAVDEMFVTVSLQLDALDGEGAARSLHDILSIDPGNQRALHTLSELGYEAPLPTYDETYEADLGAPASEAAPIELRNSHSPHDQRDSYTSAPDYPRSPRFALDSPSEPPPRHGAPDEPLSAADVFGRTSSEAVTDDLYDPEAPLPTYELDEIGQDDGAGPMLMPAGHAPGRTSRLGVVDDPFGTEEPLPAFPLEPPESEISSFGSARPLAAAPNLDSPDTEMSRAATTQTDHAQMGAPIAEYSGEGYAAAAYEGFAGGLQPSRRPAGEGSSMRPIAELEDALEEADFFASRGLFDDARAVLSEQLARLPNHPLLNERMHELEQQEQAAAQTSGTRAMPGGNGGPEDRSFDIAASLDAMESLDEATGPVDPLVHGQVDVEEVFAKFKEGVNKQISADDADMHYDLGIAYKEIGKLDDAIKEFELAVRDPNRACICESMIGMIHVDRGATNDAIEAFLRGLHAPVRSADQETMLSFELGNAYELKRNFKEALVYYQRVARWEPNYRDVQDRVRRLSKNAEPEKPVRAVAVGAEDDEFERAFDEMLGRGKMP